jgi:hypothetical protein
MLLVMEMKPVLAVQMTVGVAMIYVVTAIVTQMNHVKPVLVIVDLVPQIMEEIQLVLRIILWIHMAIVLHNRQIVPI